MPFRGPSFDASGRRVLQARIPQSERSRVRKSPLAPSGDAPVDERDIRMLRRPNHPLALLAGALVLPLCLIRPVLADPSGDLSIDADIVVPASAHAAEAQSQRELFATAGTGLTIEFDNRDVDIELFEAALPPDIPAPAAHDPAAMSLVEASADEGAVLQSADFDVALFEAGLPRDIPAPAGEAAAAILPTTNADEGRSAPTSAAKIHVPHFRRAPFEAKPPPR